MRWQDHIVATPDTLHGWPRFRDTRIPVSIVLDNLAAGVTPEDLFTDCPTLPKEAISADQHLAGANDERLLTVAASEGRTLVTLDRDFTNILRHPPAPTAGIVVIRLQDQTLPRIRHVATNLAARLMQESARGRLWCSMNRGFGSGHVDLPNRVKPSA